MPENKETMMMEEMPIKRIENINEDIYHFWYFWFTAESNPQVGFSCLVHSCSTEITIKESKNERELK